MLSALDPLLITAAFVILFIGTMKQRSAWRTGREAARSRDWSGLLKYLIGHKKIMEKKGPGTWHILLFWGFLFPLIVVILAQFGFSFPPIPVKILSLFLDLIGGLFLVGVILFLIRRIGARDPRGPKRSLFPLLILCFIIITGFLAEGARLSILKPESVWIAPIGRLFSKGMPPSPFFMQLMIRFHFFTILLFIAIVPFTFARHLIASSLNVLYRKRTARGALNMINLNEHPVGAETVKDLTWKQLLDAEACVSCGRCEDQCPASLSGKPLSPRKIIQEIREQIGSTMTPLPLSSIITDDEVWSCTTCMACVEHCPVYIEPMEKIIDMRRYAVMGKGRLPATAGSMIRDLEIYGDPQGQGSAHREDWALNRDVPLYHAKGLKPQILLWVGCSGAFHPRYQETTRAMVKVMKAAGISFGILGRGELCCGDPARRLGEESLFLDLARRNIQGLKENHIDRVVTLCPHCFNTLKNEYPLVEAGWGSKEGSMEVIHASEYVMGLIREQRLSLKYPISGNVAVHDPCYLGRINGNYKALRDVIRSLPEARLRELNRHHENGFCCGGGGGGMWLHEHLGRRMNVVRAEEVSEVGIELLGTACPYCLTMLEDGMNSLEMENPPKVLDVIEMVAHSIG